MNDIKTIYNVIDNMKKPIAKPSKLINTKEFSDEYVHDPYSNERVNIAQYPKKGNEFE